MKFLFFCTIALVATSDFSKFYREILVRARDPVPIRDPSGESRDPVEQFLDLAMNRHHRRQLSAMIDNLAQGPGTHARKHGLGEFTHPVAFKPRQGKATQPAGTNRKRIRRTQYLNHFLKY